MYQEKRKKIHLESEGEGKSADSSIGLSLEEKTSSTY
jgi:hypothetical protein